MWRDLGRSILEEFVAGEVFRPGESAEYLEKRAAAREARRESNRAYQLTDARRTYKREWARAKAAARKVAAS